jgi:dTDP-4-amino-4,6-dideoxygalactose transaminase
VFVDIEADGFNIDPALIERAIGPRTKAILCVHQLGMPCDLASISETAGRHGIAVIEDAACAIGSEILWKGQWERIGKPHADIACFSFHPRKVITTGDGGMLTTANPEYDRKFRLWRQHSMSVSDTVRHGARQVIFESYPEVGFNYRMTDLQAAVGREQLKRLPQIVERRRVLADRYRTLLADVEMVSVPLEPNWARSNWQSFAVTLAPELNQLAVMQSLLDFGVAARRGVMCSHREAAYRSNVSLPRSEHAQDSSVILPLYTQLTDGDVEFVVDALKRSVAATRPAHV